MAERWAEGLFAAGIAGESVAGRLLRLVCEQTEAVLTMARYELTARLAVSESGLRYALLKLQSAGLMNYRTARGVVSLMASPPRVPRESQRELFGEASEETPAGGLLPCPVGVVEAEGRAEAAPARRPAETELGADEGAFRAADAQRESAARSRRAAAAGLVAPAAHGREEKPQAIEIAEVMKQFPHLAAGLADAAACGVHSPIPHSPPHLVKQDIPSGGNVAKRAEGWNGPAPRVGRGGQIAAWKRKITALVKLDPRYPWVAWSAALLAIDGPLSEAVLAGCVEGCHGSGAKFVAAIKRRLAECDVGELSRRTLVDERQRPRLHRFEYLRPQLAQHGIQLADGDTGLVRSRRRA